MEKLEELFEILENLQDLYDKSKINLIEYYNLKNEEIHKFLIKNPKENYNILKSNNII